MKNLYLYLNIGSLLIPLVFSFYPKFQFYKKWTSLFPAIFIMMAFFISWDIIFTNNGIWGFNPQYINGFKLFNLPLEEWLFFICIPYACLFTHYSLQYFFPNFTLSQKATSVFYVCLLCVLIITLWYNYDKWYTLVNFGYAIILLGLVYNKNPRLLGRFLPSYFVTLIPFFLVNGVLTGSFIENQVVWYNNAENLHIRIFTIPIEDTIYSLGMLLTVFVLVEYFESKKIEARG